MANNDLVGSVLKAMDVLVRVGQDDRGMRPSEIAEALGMKRPAVHNLVRTLIAGGFLEKRDTKRLHIGPVFLAIAERQRHGRFMTAAESAVEDLARRLPEAVVVFGLVTENDVRQWLRVSWERPELVQHIHGVPFAPYTSAAALVASAWGSNAFRAAQETQYPFDEYGAHAWNGREAFEGFLRDIRRRGVAVSPFDRAKTLRVTAPVFEFDGGSRLAAVLGASIPVERSRPEHPEDFVVRTVKDAGDRLSRLLPAPASEDAPS